jgi:CheY-like chemotaxis protein
MPKKVLVVDDEEETQSLIEYVLKGGGFEVALCGNGREAFDRIEKEKPDLLILDLMLPGVDGYSIQEKLSHDMRLKNIPVIVLTALQPAEAMFRKFPNVAGFMVKPFKVDALLELVKKACAPAQASH